MSTRNVRGRLVTVSGIDGSGKSTLVAGLAGWLRASGREAVTLRPMHRDPAFLRALAATRQLVPDDPAWANQVEHVIGRHTCWVMAANFCEAAMPALERRAVVITDRWVADHVASQRWFGVRLDPGEAPLRHLPEPGLQLFVDCAPETAQERIERRGSVASPGSGRDFLAFFRNELRSYFADREHVVVDGELAPEAALERAIDAVREHLSQSPGG